jgi:hypothetical protein
MDGFFEYKNMQKKPGKKSKKNRKNQLFFIGSTPGHPDNLTCHQTGPIGSVFCLESQYLARGCCPGAPGFAGVGG